MKRVRPIGAALLALGATLALHAGDAWDRARAVAEKTATSAVRVRVVSEMKIDNRGQNVEREQKSEIDGTVVDPSGLTVVSATALNPSSMISRMMRGMKIEMNVKETTLLLADGSEVPSEVVLKDTDLDLAFIRPKEPGKTNTHVALKPHPTPPQPLDDVFLIGRLGKNANRALFVNAGKVRACIKGPRPYYICTRDVSETTGCMVYTADGEALGVLLIQKAPGEDGDQGMPLMLGGAGGDLAVVRPVEDVIEGLKQALEAQPAAKP